MCDMVAYPCGRAARGRRPQGPMACGRRPWWRPPSGRLGTAAGTRPGRSRQMSTGSQGPGRPSAPHQRQPATATSAWMEDAAEGGRGRQAPGSQGTGCSSSEDGGTDGSSRCGHSGSGVVGTAIQGTEGNFITGRKMQIAFFPKKKQLGVKGRCGRNVGSEHAALGT